MGFNASHLIDNSVNSDWGVIKALSLKLPLVGRVVLRLMGPF